MRCLLAAVLLFAAGPSAHAEPVRLRVGTITPEGSPYFEAARVTLRRIAANSRRGVDFRLMGGGSFGDEQTLIEEVRKGVLEATAVTSTAAEAIVPELSVFSLPYLFRDGAEADQVIDRVFPQLAELFERRGYWLMAHTMVGFRHIGSARPIRSLEDLRGVVARSQPGPLHARMWELLRVPHRPLGQLEVMGQLESGAVTGFDGSIPWIFAAAWHTRIKHLTLTGHMYQPGFMFMGPKGLAAMPQGLKRAALMNGLLPLCRQANLASRKVEAELLRVLPGTGVTVTEPPVALVGELRATLLPVHEEWKRRASPEGAALLAAVERELERLRKSR